MAVTVTEQMRLPTQSSDDPRQFGDGAPMHSSIAYDLIRQCNNLQTKCEPSYGFAHDASHAMPSNGTPKLKFFRPSLSYPSSSTFMMAQVPILVPVQAKSMSLSFGFRRLPAAGETTLSVIITSFDAYLAAGPVTHLLDPVVATPNEQFRKFDKSYISLPYSHLSDGLGLPSSATDATTVYTKLRYLIYTPSSSTAWKTFVTPDNIIDRNGDARAVLIFALSFQSMAVGEGLQTGECSWWFNYEA